MANRNWANAGHFYAYHVKPVLIDCNFQVAQTNPNGLGITNLKGPCVSQVYMHTTVAPSGNPNPPSGYIFVKLQDNYNTFLSAFGDLESPLSGANLTSVTQFGVYVITSLGTTTTAQWNAVGVPLGFTPAVGMSFVASATQAIGGTGTVQTIANSGSNIDHLEVVGDPNQSIENNMQPTYGGGYLIFACFRQEAIQQPTDGTVISIDMYFNDSYIKVQGE